MRFLIIFLGVFLFASIGHIKEIKGDVKVLRAQKTLKAYVNMPVEIKDTIITYGNSKAKIVFKDKTLITIGKDSVFKIKDYFLGKKPKANFSFLKGTFISVTGKIGKIAPKRFKLETKNASIGIRGTIVFGETFKKEDIIGCSEGLISVSKNGRSVLVSAGKMVKVFERVITPPVKIPASYVKHLISNLSLKKHEIKSFFKKIYKENIKSESIKSKKVKKEKTKNKNININQSFTEHKKSALKWNDYKREATLKKVEKVTAPVIVKSKHVISPTSDSKMFIEDIKNENKKTKDIEIKPDNICIPR
jgi:hypothetical protein